MFDVISNWITCWLIKRGILREDQYDSFDMPFRGILLESLIIVISIGLGVMLYPRRNVVNRPVLAH